MTPQAQARWLAIIELAVEIDRLLATLQDTTNSHSIYEACKRVRSALR